MQIDVLFNENTGNLIITSSDGTSVFLSEDKHVALYNLLKEGARTE